ncbi:ribosomal RNA processing protein 1 homolog A [Apodemus sylvaticus]|uniref:ribosomal RNA processing protein 1 homolog A n=1 Tax=Apodemus sylvaticus TaxID=10129 RepID=UPI002244779B|nr:ribosomal RNA processing protein 1 homolog A [Apodemus sylvaticus]
MVPGVPLPPEIQLAQRLAGNEQVTRDRALRKLRKYIVARSQRATGGFTPEELLKVWKGLFYCMWMQDKPLQQEELGRTIAQLVHAFQTVEAQLQFLQAFWQTMIREWVGIDRLRLDKFYMLMRMVLNESLKAVKTRGWEERQIEQLLELMTAEVLSPDSQAPSGVKSHFLEIFLEELTKVGAAELTANQNLQFIDPFCQIAAHTKDSLVLHKIIQNIFEAIVEQAPLAIEDIMNELDTQSGKGGEASVGDDGDASDGDDGDASDGDDGDASDGDDGDVSDEDDGDASDGDDGSASDGDDDDASDGDDGGVSNENDGDSDESSEDEQDLQDTSPKKLPAGTVRGAGPEADKEQAWDEEENTGPVLQFDYGALANRLFKLASRQSTPSRNRKRLYKVIQKLRDLAGGTFPEDDVPEKAYKKLLEGRRERKKKKKRSPKPQPQNKEGGSETEASSAGPSTGRKRKRGRGADGKRGPPGKRSPGARAKGAGVQPPKRKRNRPAQSAE